MIRPTDTMNGLTEAFTKMSRGTAAKSALTALFAAAVALTSCEKTPGGSTPPYTEDDIDMDTRIKEYVEASFSSEITRVTVTDDKVTISGRYAGKGDFIVAEIPPFMDLLEMETSFSELRPDTDDFTIEVERSTMARGFTYDRIFSRWAIFEDTGEGLSLASFARYADEVPLLSSPATVPLKNKKGMGGIHRNEFLSDFDELDLGSATLNLFVTQFSYLSPGAGRTEHEFGGRKYYFDENFITENLDKVLLEAGARGMAVAGILLVQPASTAMDRELAALLTDPHCNGGTLIMPNMTDIESVNCFAAITDFLVKRYTREDGKYGRIAQWIVLNEVDGGTSWANMGYRPMYVYTDYYIKVMRLVNNIVRQHDPNAETFASFTHSWTRPALDYPAKSMMEIISTMGRNEGDYRWALACHSYPWDLLNPRVWEDRYATPSMDAGCVSFLNLEVLDKWVKMPEHMYRGTEKRSVWLSEAGVNSRSYSDADLAEQAAGTALAWKKIAALDGIDGLQWHNWFDNAGEGADARLGLRKYNDEEYHGEAKPAWHIYRAAGTEDEDKAFESSLSIIGIDSWDEIMYDEIH